MSPGNGRGPDAHHDAEATSTTRTTTDQGNGSTSEYSAQSATMDGWKRRRAATKRLVPLACGCRDPWLCRCHRRVRRSR